MAFLGICLLLKQIGVWDELQPRTKTFHTTEAAARATADWFA